MRFEHEDIATEFEELMDIASYMMAEKQEKGLTMEQFFQLVLDIRTSERNPVDLHNKNIVIPETIVLQ